MSGGAAITSTSTSVAGKITGLFGNAAGNIGGALKTQIGGAIGAIGAVFAASKIIGFFGDAIGAASDLGETVSKVGVIFGKEALPGLEKWAEAASEALGLSKQQALDAAATFATFGKSAGLAGEQLVGFSTELVGLASDLASFHNAEPQEVIQALGAALRGEAEPMRRFGVLLDDATLKARAMELGIISTTKNALTPQQKVLAAQAEILAQTSDAQGDFDRTSDSLANQQRILGAELENVTAEIGQALLPVMVELAHFANDSLIPAIKGVIEWFGNAIDAIASFANEVDAQFLGLAISFGDLGKEIENEANKFNLDVQEMKVNYSTAVTDMGLEGAEAMAAAVRMTQGLPLAIGDSARQSLAAWKQEDLGGGVAADLEGGEGVVTAGAGAMAGGIPGAVADAGAAAEEVAREIPGNIADAIISGEAELDPIKDLVAEILAGSVSDAATLAENAATLVNPGITRGLQSNSLQTRQDMLHDVVEPLVASIATLGPNALITGAGIPANLRDGVFAQRDLAIDEVTRLRDAIAPGMDLAEFAREHGLEAVAALIEAMASQEANAEHVARVVASRAANALGSQTGTASAGGVNTGGAFTSGVGSKYYEGFTKGSNVGGNTVAGLNFGGRNAGAGGASIVNSWLNGMWYAYWARRRATIDAIANDAGNVFGRSLPRSGPLKGGLRSGGLSVGESWVEGLAAGLSKMPGRIDGALRGVPLMRPLAFSAAGLEAARTMVTNTSSVTHNNGGATININLTAPNFRGGRQDVSDLSRQLAEEIRMRSGRSLHTR